MLIDKPLSLDQMQDYSEAKDRIESFYSTIENLYEANNKGALRVSINGAWGTGKSSYLSALRTKYEDKGSKVVTFEAWRYAHEPDIFLALLEEIYASLGKDSSVKRGLRSVIKSIGVASLVGSDIMLKMLVKQGVSDIEGRFKSLEASIRWQTTRYRNDMKRLNSLIKKLGSKDKPFVLLIDDLDRLIPQKAFDLLEKLRFYLEGDNLIIVMAINDEVINTFVHDKYGVDHSTQMSEAFIDKIFHYSFDLSFEPLNSLHLRSIEDRFSSHKEAIEEYFDQITLRLPHRKWINTLNRIEDQLKQLEQQREDQLKIDISLSDLGLVTMITVATLKELFSDFKYLYRRDERSLLDPDSKELEELRDIISEQRGFSIVIFDRLIEILHDPTKIKASIKGREL